MLIPAGFAQVNYRFTGTNAPTGAEVTLGLDISGFSGNTAGIAQAAGDAWEGTILTRQVEAIRLNEVLVKVGPNDTGPSALVPIGTDGSISGQAEAPAVSYLVQKLTAMGGRQGRGRMFVPGCPEGYVTSAGNINPENFNSVATEMTDFYDALVLADLLPVLLHAPDSPITTPTPIVGFELSGRVATQRRRQRR